MFVVTKDGYKIDVQEPDYKDEDWCPFQQTVGLYTDNTVLEDVWILNLYNREYLSSFDKFSTEFVKELKYDHEPTKEEILWAMSAYGITRGGIASVDKAYELEMDDNSEDY